jgi:hypothetical protein
VLTVASTTARANPGGVPEALNQVNATLNALIATVSQLVAKVNQLTTSISGSAFLATSSVRAIDQGVTCEVVNAGVTAAPVTIKLINASGEVLGTFATQLGAGTSSYLFKPLAGSHTVHCSFDSAQASQLRANLSMLEPNGARISFTMEAR